MSVLRTTLCIAATILTMAACAAEFEGPPPRLDHVDEPIALTTSNDGCTVFLANGNFDLRERGGGIVVVDVADRRVLPNSGVEVSSFPAQLRLHPDGTKLYATVRGDDSITWIDVRDADGDGNPDLSCGEGPEDRCSGERTRHLARTAGSKLRVSEPLGIELTCDRRGGGCDTPQGGELGLVTTWLRSGVVAYFPLDEQGVPVGEPELDDTGIRLVEDDQQQNEVTVRGVAGLAIAPDGRSGFIASFANDRLRRFKIEIEVVNINANQTRTNRVLRLEESQAVVGATYDNRATELRGIAVDQLGNRVFLASRHPVANRPDPTQIYIVDTPTDKFGNPDFRISAAVPVSGTPGLLRLLPGDPDATPPRADLLYTVIFGADRIAVIDSLRMDVIGTIDVGAGPFDLTFVLPPSDSACAINDEGRPRMEAWVTEFVDNSLAIIDIDPASPTYHEVIARVP